MSLHQLTVPTVVNVKKQHCTDLFKCFDANIFLDERISVDLMNFACTYFISVEFNSVVSDGFRYSLLFKILLPQFVHWIFYITKIYLKKKGKKASLQLQ